VVEERAGVELVSWRYSGPFDDLPAQQGIEHRVVAWDEVSETEGTGVVHIAPGAGREDFALGRRLGLPVLAPLDDDGIFVAGYGWLTGRRAGEVAEEVATALERQGRLFAREPYTHRYPVCWRCGSELVFRLVDEWLIRMDELRQSMMETARQAAWIPSFGLERELDWLRNMDDWMISKKRYWGLALPIYPCGACGHVTVIGSKEELRERAVAGWETFEGHSPHRPWVDAVTIGCTQCGAPVTRVPDVGNPWLDAGIVAFSTLNYHHDRDYWAQWFPADLVLESFPGQFRNWFYALLAMSTALEGRAPFRTLLGYATVKDEHGEEMHKSKGNSIPFEQAAEWSGVEPLRWMFAAAPLERNLHLGRALVEEHARRLQPLWEVYRFFVTYANLAGWRPGDGFQRSTTSEHAPQPASSTQHLLDQWLLARLDQLTATAPERLDAYDVRGFTQEIERFLDDLSNWYVRRSRRRFWATGRSGAAGARDQEPGARSQKPETRSQKPGARRGAMQRGSTAPGNAQAGQNGDNDVAFSDDESHPAFAALYTTLMTLARLLAPVLPFLSEALYQNLVRSVDPEAPVSVHLTGYPGAGERPTTDPGLSRDEGDRRPTPACRSTLRLRSGQASSRTAGTKATDDRWPTRDGTGAMRCTATDYRLLTTDYQLRLLADMDVVRRVVALGRSARRAAKLRLRLPLARVLVVVGTPEERAALERLRAELLDELNIKDMEVLDGAAALLTYRVKPNLHLLGPKLGRSLAALRPVLDDLEPARAAEVAREITAGRAVMLTLEAGTLTLAPEELLVESMPLDGYAVAQDGGLQVALDTRLTESLRREGMARDLVRAVQEARKAAGLAPADRITLYLSGAPALKAVLDEWDAYVRGETLATVLISSDPPAGVYHEQVALEEGELVIGIGPAGESRGEGVKG
jgi:isoleucyl-tRNA synthetase